MSHPLPTRNCAAVAGVHDPTLNVRRMEPQGVSEPIPQGPVTVCHTAAFHLSDCESCQGVGQRKNRLRAVLGNHAHVRACMCVHTCIHRYVYIRIYMCMYVLCVRLYVYALLYYVHTCTNIYSGSFMHLYTFRCVHMSTCVHVCLFMHACCVHVCPCTPTQYVQHTSPHLALCSQMCLVTEG